MTPADSGNKTTNWRKNDDATHRNFTLWQPDARIHVNMTRADFFRCHGVPLDRCDHVKAKMYELKATIRSRLHSRNGVSWNRFSRITCGWRLADIAVDRLQPHATSHVIHSVQTAHRNTDMHAHVHTNTHAYERTNACTHACTRAHTHTHTNTHTNTHTYFHTHTHMNTHTHKQTHTHAHTYTHTHTHIHTHTRTHAHARAHTHTHIHQHTHTHTHTQTYTHTKTYTHTQRTHTVYTHTYTETDKSICTGEILQICLKIHSSDVADGNNYAVRWTTY